MAMQPMTDDSPFVIRARSIAGVVAGLGTMFLTAYAIIQSTRRARGIRDAGS